MQIPTWWPSLILTGALKLDSIPKLISNWGISEFPCASVSKQVFMQKLSCENELDLLENEPIGRIYFHMNGFTDSFQHNRKATQKWCIVVV